MRSECVHVHARPYSHLNIINGVSKVRRAALDEGYKIVDRRFYDRFYRVVYPQSMHILLLYIHRTHIYVHNIRKRSVNVAAIAVDQSLYSNLVAATCIVHDSRSIFLYL